MLRFVADPTGLAPGAGDALALSDPRTGPLNLYRAAGSETAPGPAVLLVHSVNAAASAFEIAPLYRRLAGRRPTYAIDLPGFGGSDRSRREYTPRLMTDALHVAIEEIRRQHGAGAIDALALSLSCEFLARAAGEAPALFRTLALVSPTGLQKKPRDGPSGATLGRSGLRAVFGNRWVGAALFGGLTRPTVIRYFLERTFGAKAIDGELYDVAVANARKAGAEHAPLWFVSGHLFSADATRLYEALTAPVWLSHGVRGDFTDYGGADRLLDRDNWTRTIFETGAMPYFEQPDAFFDDYFARIERDIESESGSNDRMR